MEQLVHKYPWLIQIMDKPELQDITLQNLYEFYLTNGNINIILPFVK